MARLRSSTTPVSYSIVEIDPVDPTIEAAILPVTIFESTIRPFSSEVISQMSGPVSRRTFIDFA